MALHMYATNMKEFKLMHYFISLRQCEKWRQTWALLKKVGEDVNDLDAPLNTSPRRPVGHKKAKQAAARDAASDKMTASIEKWQDRVATQAIQ
jgi:hypothetical protein